MIYLYVKTHNITGLKYLGKTNNKDPHSYKGSGKYWILHCKKTRLRYNNRNNFPERIKRRDKRKRLILF